MTSIRNLQTARRLNTRDPIALASAVRRMLQASVITSALGLTSSIPAVAAPESTETPQAVLQYNQRQEIFQPQVAQGGMVASDHVLASRIGARILEQGGNAVDAAVATGFALSVVLPYAGNLGGGGFMMLHLRDQQHTTAIDFRETAPSAASHDMFLDADGKIIKRRSIESTASVGVPGSVAGLLYALQRYGTITRDQAVSPAIELARSGFTVSPTLARLLDTHRDHLYKSEPNRAVFFKKTNEHDPCVQPKCPIASLRTLQPGDRLVQPDLANTLEQIAANGAAGFYEGPVAKAIAQTVSSGSGNISLDDLRNYQVKEREPLWAAYRGIEIASMPPPSSGGVHLTQMLNMLSTWPIRESGWGSAANLHRFSEVAKLAYADRATYLGDPDFVAIPTHRLIDPDYAKTRMQLINDDRATPSQTIMAGSPTRPESTETTHFSVADRWGNLVSTTTTLNLNFGSGWMARGTGVLLNNEMDDFSIKPGEPNAFGLVGSQANAIQAGKRPLSSMTPTLLFKRGEPWIATGTPGGGRIITIVLQFVLNVIDFDMNIATASAMPRAHHQWLPDKLWLEQGFSPDTVAILRRQGHDVMASRAAGRLQSVAFESGRQLGASDPRSTDGAAIGAKIDSALKPLETTGR